MASQATALAAFALACAASASAQDTYLLPPQSSVAGMSQADWSRAWWQWAASFERSQSPVADTTGALCAQGQSGPVWFLAGTYGTRRTIRSCTVPRGKYLFFPLINYVVARSVDEPSECAAIQNTAARITNEASMLVLELDGQKVTDLAAHRQVPQDCFDLGVRTPNKVRIFPAAANGYYVMLKPLPPGKHTIQFGGALPSMLQAVSYTLVVE